MGYELVDLGVTEARPTSFVLLNTNDVVVVTIGAGCNSRIRKWEAGTWTDLGALGSCGAVSTAMNRHGDVVGWSPTADGSPHAFLWSRGVMQDLGTLGGAESRALGINHQRAVVGDAMLADGSRHAVLWADGRITDLGTLEDGPASSATHINERGEIAGWSDLPPRGSINPRRSFVWRDGVMTDAGRINPGGIPDWSEPLALTRSGSVAGDAILGSPSSVHRGYVWSGGTLTALPPLPDHSVSQAVAALDRGWVVGHSARFYLTERPSAVLWRPGGQSENLGRLTFEAACRVNVFCGGGTGEWVRDVNDAGVIVGRSGSGNPANQNSNGPAHAFVWQNGTMLDLGTLGGTFSEAQAVNEHGTIAGVTTDADGQFHIVLWRPVAVMASAP